MFSTPRIVAGGIVIIGLVFGIIWMIEPTVGIEPPLPANMCPFPKR